MTSGVPGHPDERSRDSDLGAPFAFRSGQRPRGPRLRLKPVQEPPGTMWERSLADFSSMYVRHHETCVFPASTATHC